MKALKYLLFFLLVFEIFSCKKINYKTTSVKAYLFDESSQQYVPNRKIVLYELENKAIGSYPRYSRKILKEVYTNANGLADFGEFEAHRSDKFNYSVDVGDYFTLSPEYSNLKRGESNSITFKVTAYVDFTLKFIQPPPYNTGDSLSISFTNPNYYPMYSVRITNSNYYQYNINRLSSGFQYINIDKFKSGVYTNTKDTVFYPAYCATGYYVYW